MELKPRARRVRWPCLVCNRECRGPCMKDKNIQSVECSLCSGWVHEVCASLTSSSFEFFSKNTSTYLCGRCVADKQRNKYCYRLGLERIRKSPTSVTVENETQLMRLYGVTEEQRDQDFNATTVGTVDDIAEAILQRFQPAMLSQYTPLATVGDGNCCYRAVSLGRFGTEELHEYVRLVTAFEIIENKDEYDVDSDGYTGQLKRESMLTSSYSELVENVTTINQPVTLMHLFGISAAIGCAIQSYIPPTVSLGLQPNPYTVKIVGRAVRRQSGCVVNLMWSAMHVPLLTDPYLATHIVLLSQRVSSVHEVSDNAMGNESSLEELDITTNTQHAEDEPQDRLGKTNAMLINNNDQVGNGKEIVAAVLLALPRPTGLTTAEVLSILQQQPTETILPRIPFGAKSNVYCVVDNTGNRGRTRRGQKNVYDDDCGAWSNTSYCSYPYLIVDGDEPRRIFWIAAKGRYCRERRICGKCTYDPLEPQPSTNQVVTLVRYTSVSSVNPEYRRRVTWLTAGDDAAGDVAAVVEYMGEFVRGRPHGLCADANNAEPYVRTPKETMAMIGDMTEKVPAKMVYNKLNYNLNIEEQPRNMAVVENKKYRVRKHTRQAEGLAKGVQNFGDEFQAVFNMVQSDRGSPDWFVRYAIATGCRVPGVILYNDNQIRDIKAFCFGDTSSSVLSFDKTFNLGTIYVTVSVYKNLALKRRRTEDHPLFIGPIYLHGHSDIETYSFFYSHLASRLIDCQFSTLTMGSDEETAMRRCMASAFPGAAILTCTRHVKKNAEHKLDSLIGNRSSDRRAIHTAVFGEAGITSCDDVITFDEMVERFRINELAAGPLAFTDYFDRQVHQQLRGNVSAGRPRWTNNNCESVNHILKQYVQWKQHLLPDLIVKLRELVRGQCLEADRAICGVGDFVLQPAYSKHRVTVDAWRTMTEAQRSKASNTCFRQQLPVSSSVSSDGQLTVPLTPGAGKKLHQRKRPRAEKTSRSHKTVRFAE